MKPSTIVFDLDDTLIFEIDFVESAFNEIANIIDNSNVNLSLKMMEWFNRKENVFLNLQKINSQYSISDLIKIYREHIPKFDSTNETKNLLVELKNKGHILGLITDGYSITQRNKLKALSIEYLFDLIVISEEVGSVKPNVANYILFDNFKSNCKYYIADNTNKDFITPNKLGWTTVCLIDHGKNIHKQNFDLSFEYLPKMKINKLKDLLKII